MKERETERKRETETQREKERERVSFRDPLYIKHEPGIAGTLITFPLRRVD